MAEVYRHEYLPVSIYGNVVSLLREQRPEGDVHLDIGCGYGAIAEPIRDEAGLEYLGFDAAEDGLESIRSRGFSGHQIDLADVTTAERNIREVVGVRRIASITMIDTLEHVFNGSEILSMIRRLANKHGSPLVLSVPNVAHKDIALKLLIGRWDITEAGLLDHTHVQLYNYSRLASLMVSVGWHEVSDRDWRLEQSDQMFPTDSAVLNRSTPIGGFLRRLIDHANPYAQVNQFVRAYRPVVPKSISLFVDREASSRYLLTIVLAGPPGRNWKSVLAKLAAQSSQDFEILMYSDDRNIRGSGCIPMNLRDRLHTVSRNHEHTEGRDALITRAAGRYMAVLSETDLWDPSCVATFSELHKQQSGKVLQLARRLVLRSQMPVDPLCADGHDCSSIAEFALPIGFLRELRFRFPATMRDLRGWAHEAVLMCGLAKQKGATDSVPFEGVHVASSDPLYAVPSLMPAGAARHIHTVARTSGIPNQAYLDHGLVDLVRSHEPAASALEGEASGPLLSIITRTMGERETTLRDTLLCLAGQSCQDFELLLVVHSELNSLVESARALVAEFPDCFGQRVSVLQCTRPGRGAPLNDAVRYARGQYICVLDDDDLVFGHFVETYRDLASSHPDSILRTTCTRQDFETHTAPDGTRLALPISWFIMAWPSKYNGVAHLHHNETPFMSVAFPAALIHTQNLSFDETLGTTEDWDFTTRAAMMCAIASSPEVTSIYRWWNLGSSSHFHAQSEWDANRTRIVRNWDRCRVTLPPGSVGEVNKLIDDYVTLAGHAQWLEKELNAVKGSRLWRALAPLRSLAAWFGGLRRIPRTSHINE